MDVGAQVRSLRYAGVRAHQNRGHQCHDAQRPVAPRTHVGAPTPHPRGTGREPLRGRYAFVQTGLRISKDVGESRSLIQMLVGVAMERDQPDGRVEEWMPRPASPNLYSAVGRIAATVPRTLSGVEGEGLFFETMFPNVKEFEKGPLSAPRGRTNCSEPCFKDRRPGSGAGRPMPDGNAGKNRPEPLASRYLSPPNILPPRRSCWRTGCPRTWSGRTPPAQAVALKSIRLVRQIRTDMRKGFLLPYRLGRAGVRETNGWK